MSSAAAPIGLIAGSGRFPLLFAQAAARAGRPVIAVAHEGETDPKLEAAVVRFNWVKLGQLGRIAELLRDGGCTEAVLCGGVGKVRLFSLRPDWLGLQLLARLRTFGDDAALRGIADLLAERGVQIISPLPLLPELLCPPGVLGRKSLTSEQRKDAEVGLHTARGLGALDIGQTVVVKRGVVLAVEAAEGTDACITRGGELARGGGAGPVVVKVQKPGQDTRFDLPAVGPATIAALARAGCSALALEAGKSLVIDREQMTADADAAGIAIEGL